MHVGISRSADTDETAVTKNVKTARITMHSLMPAGLHVGKWSRTLNITPSLSNLCSAGPPVWYGSCFPPPEIHGSARQI